MIPLEEAVEKLLAAIRPLPTETVPITQAAARITAKEILSPTDLPRFDNSAMDGWALRSADTGPRRIAGRTPAGAIFEGKLNAGECVRLFTGSPLPEGADAVVMQEGAPEENGLVTILDPPKPWENVRFRGEDVKAGAAICPANIRITPAIVGLLGACGVPHLEVHQRPKIAILATGSELRDPGSELIGGQIYESNRAMIAALIQRLDMDPIILPAVRDDLASSTAALTEAARSADAIVTSGGVSVGEYDFVKAAIEALNGSVDLWRVAIKPGKPFVFANVLGKPVFGLPGNPVSALVTFALLARPALLRMAGLNHVAPETTRGQLAENFSNPGDRRHFVRVQIDQNGAIRSTGPQASHRLMSLAVANALLDMPARANQNKGTQATVILL